MSSTSGGFKWRLRMPPVTWLGRGLTVLFLQQRPFHTRTRDCVLFEKRRHSRRRPAHSCGLRSALQSPHHSRRRLARNWRLAAEPDLDVQLEDAIELDPDDLIEDDQERRQPSGFGKRSPSCSAWRAAGAATSKSGCAGRAALAYSAANPRSCIVPVRSTSSKRAGLASCPKK